VTLKAKKPLSSSYPKKLKTLGDHLRKKRLDLKLLQKEVAKRIGVNETTIWNWENNCSSPSLSYIPKIIKFLGYVPDCIKAKTFGEKIVISHQLHGLTQKDLAHRLGIDPSTLGRWERNESKPEKELLKKLNTFLKKM